MIITEAKYRQSKNKRILAGQKQEQQVSFYLNREFKNSSDLFIFNDLRLSHDNENAQIDHLVIHKYGFIIIESKSIYGEVKINQAGEWQRNYKGGRFEGMPSPIKQVELQHQLLKQLLNSKSETLLGKTLGLQSRFGGRDYQTVIATSNNTVLHRKYLKKEYNEVVVRAESVVEKVKNIIKPKGFLFDERPSFNKDELINILNFLTPDIDKQQSSSNRVEPSEAPVLAEKSPETINLYCDHCNSEIQLIPKSGRYGYYIRCGNCEKNTALKRPCPVCSSKKTKASKNKDQYHLNCTECEVKTPFEPFQD